MSGSITDLLNAVGQGQNSLAAPNQAPPQGALTDPFNYNQAGSNTPGMFGQTQGFWRDMARLGANISGAANARTPQGFLANGTGFGPAVAAGIGQTYQQGQQDAITRSELASRGAATTGQQIQNVVNASGLPLAVARNRLVSGIYNNPGSLPGLMQQFQGNAPSSGLGGAESGNNPQAVNAQGYSGQYQFGAGRLAQLGFYQPAQGENLKANQWAGQFNIPGFPQVKNQADFLSNPQAQQAVFTAHMHNIDQTIAQTPGAANFDQSGLRAVAHLGGPEGMQKFVQTGGQYNPPDSNGTHLSDYYQRFSTGGQTPGPMVPGGRSPYIGQAQQLMQQANQLELMKSLGLPVPGDPAAMRAQAQDYLSTGLKMETAGSLAGQEAGAKAQVEQATAGPIQTAKSRAEAGEKPQMDRYGNMVIGDGKGGFINLGRGAEVRDVFNTGTGNFGYGDVGGTGLGATPGTRYVPGQGIVPPQGSPQVGPRASATPPAAGGSAPQDSGAQSAQQAEQPVIAKPGPGYTRTAENVANVPVKDMDQDRKVIESTMAHAIDVSNPAKSNLLHMRDLNPDTDPGAFGEFRANMRNVFQTFAPGIADQFDVNASPAQEFKKFSILGAGKQENEDHGAARGFALARMYVEANPNLENQPDANQHMANVLLVMHQAHLDYANGAANFYNASHDAYLNPSGPHAYDPLTKYDTAFTQKMPTETYYAAANALNGRSWEDATKGMTAAQQQVVGGILKRTDPNATLTIKGQQIPVSAITKTVEPTQLVQPGGG